MPAGSHHRRPAEQLRRVRCSTATPLPTPRAGSSCPTGAPNNPQQHRTPRRAGRLLNPLRMPLTADVTVTDAADARTHQSGWVLRPGLVQVGWDLAREGRPPRGRPLRLVELAISAVHERWSGRWRPGVG